MIFPRKLAEGDRVAIVSPSSEVNRGYVEGAVKVLRQWGLKPEVAPHAVGHPCGSFAASKSNRLADLKAAMLDDEVRCIFCSRGGYGAVHLLADLDSPEYFRNPKWLVGFSDISALHALWHKHGVASIHGSMAKYLASYPADDRYSLMLRQVLMQPQPAPFRLEWMAPSGICNNPGDAEGELVGGNFAVLNGLSATPYDMFPRTAGDAILFLEDIGEQIYEIDRMMHRLWLSGTLSNIKGLVIGNFSDYRIDRNFTGMEQMIRRRLDEWNLCLLPVAFGLPCGHQDINVPLLEGARVSLAVSSTGAVMQIIDK